MAIIRVSLFNESGTKLTPILVHVECRLATRTPLLCVTGNNRATQDAIIFGLIVSLTEQINYLV